MTLAKLKIKICLKRKTWSAESPVKVKVTVLVFKKCCNQWNELGSSVLRIIIYFFFLLFFQPNYCNSHYFFDCVSKSAFLLWAIFPGVCCLRKRSKSQTCVAHLFFFFFSENIHLFSHLVTAVGHLYASLPPVGLPLFCCLSSLSSLAFLLGTVFMKAVNLQKPFFFVIDQVYFELDSQCERWDRRSPAVHFTQFQLNPIRRIGFGRSGMSLGFTIWNHISFSFSGSLAE